MNRIVKIKLSFVFLIYILGLNACTKIPAVVPEYPIIINTVDTLNDTISMIVIKNASYCISPHAAITFSPPKDSVNQYQKFQWWPSGRVSDSETVSKAGTYKLCRIAAKGNNDTLIFTVNDCVTTSSVKTISLYVPTAFISNGINKWAPVGTGIASILIEVRNVEGILAFSSTNLNEGWDGSWKGTNSKAPSGFYIYFIQYTDILGTTKKLTGNLELIR